MKSGIFVCLLVVLAIHEAVSYSGPALLTGNCKLEDLPRSVLSACQSVKCTKSSTGAVSFKLQSCSLSRCENGKELGHGKPDLTRTYPDCCPTESCN